MTQNNFQYLYWLGDINADFLRRTGHIDCVKNLIEELKLVKALENYHLHSTHYQEAGDITHTSTVDHIFWMMHMSTYQKTILIIEYCVINVDNISTESSVSKTSKPRPCWSKASSTEKALFRTSLEDDLSSIQIPDSLQSCNDVHCANEEHNNDADTAIITVLECVETCLTLSH